MAAGNKRGRCHWWW